MKKLPPVMIGQRTSVDEFREELINAGVKFGTWGTELLTRVKFSEKPKQIQLVIVSIISDLKLNDECQYQDIVAAGAKRRLQLCTLEEVCETRLAYLGQPLNEFVVAITMPEATECEYSGTVEILPTLERLAGMGRDPWLRAMPTCIKPQASSGKPACWNPFGDPQLRLVAFKANTVSKTKGGR